MVVHGTFDAYLWQAGPGAESTLGASRIEFEHGQVASRRIDVRADKSGWFDAVVPHELSHIVLADEFSGGSLPAWADEGMAVLADLPEKQSLHLRDLSSGKRSGSTFRLVSFLGAGGYPSPDKMPVFYGQSVSLVKYLVERGSPADFVRFLHLADREGYDAALAEVYGLGDVNSLERKWLASTFRGPNVLTAMTSQDRDMAAADALVIAKTK